MCKTNKEIIILMYQDQNLSMQRKNGFVRQSITLHFCIYRQVAVSHQRRLPDGVYG